MSAASPDRDRVKLKICLAGEAAVGKTSLIRRFVEDVFTDRHIATLGAKVTKRELTVGGRGSRRGIRAVLTIWDILGHRGFGDVMHSSFFRGSQGILAVCDVTRPTTLAQLEGWRNSVWETTGGVPAFVVANKVDLVEQTRLWEEDVQAFCEGWGSPYLLTSAKTGERVEEAFRGLASLILRAQRGDALPFARSR